MIDLSQLPPPEVVEVVEFETIVAEMLADLDARMLADDPDWETPGVSDPTYKLIEVVAYRELLLRQDFNERAVSLLVAYSTGATLEHLVAFLGLTRDGRTDDELRAAWFDALAALSVAGPASAYSALARKVSGVKDAYTYRPAPGIVRVVVLSATGDGSADAGLLADVSAALADDEDVRPLTDTVEVVSAEIITYTVAVEIEPDSGPSPEAARAEAEAAATAYTAAQHGLGRSMLMFRLNGALDVEGVKGVTHSGVTADVITGPTQAPYAESVTVTLPEE